MKKQRKTTFIAFFSMLAMVLVGATSVLSIRKSVNEVGASTTYSDTIKKAIITTGGNTVFTDGQILEEGTDILNISRTGSREAEIVTKYLRNNASTHTIMNNSAGEIRLYPKSGEGGGLSFEISEGYYFTGITVTASGTTGAVSINGGPSTDITSSVKVVSATFSAKPTLINFKNSKNATSSANLQIVSVLVLYEQQQESSDVVTSLSVNPTTKSYFTTSTLQESDFIVSIMKNGSAGSSSDYTVQIGTGVGASFNGFDVSWGSTKPLLSHTTLQFKAKYPQTPNGTDYLCVDVTLTVTEPDVSNIKITGSMTITSYFTTGSWNPSGLVVTATYEDSTTADVTNDVEWSYNPTQPNNINITSVVVTASLGLKTDSITQSVTVTQKVSTIVISEAYGGGGNSGATYKQDFIELYNNTNAPIDLDGYHIFYASAAGNFSDDPKYFTALSGSILAKSYFLIQEAAGSGGTVDLPTPDLVGAIAMSGTAFKVALTNSDTTPLGSTSSNVVDFLGAGTNANDFETSKAPAPSNSNSISRTIEEGICVDTDVNGEDFVAGAPTPMNSALGVAEKIMAYSSVHISVAECAEKYDTIKPLVLSLSEEQLTFFKNEEDIELMVNARARYLNWAAANRDSTPYANGSLDGKTNFFSNKNNAITIVILISVLGVSTLAGYYFLRKKPKEEKAN